MYYNSLFKKNIEGRTCEEHRINFGIWLSLLIMLTIGNELRALGLVVNIINCCAILPAASVLIDAYFVIFVALLLLINK